MYFKYKESDLGYLQPCIPMIYSEMDLKGCKILKYKPLSLCARNVTKNRKVSFFNASDVLSLGTVFVIK